MDKATHPFVLELLDSYRKVGGLNNQDAHNTPSKRAVGQICEDLLRLLFPGFHDDDAVEHDSLLEITSERMEVVVSRLEDQVPKERADRRSEAPHGPHAADHETILQVPSRGARGVADGY